MKPTELRPVMVRIPEGLRRRLAKEAEREGRSMNTEIIHRLERSFDAAAEALPINLAQALANTVERLVEVRLQQREASRRAQSELPLGLPRVREPEHV